MTVRLIEGFETDQEVAYIRSKYQNRPSAITTTTGRRFGKAALGLTLVTKPLIASPGPEWVVGFGWKLGGNPDTATDFVKFFNGGLDQLGVHISSTRFLEVRRGTTLLATGTTQLPVADWSYVEFKALLHTSAGSYELRLNGVLELSASGIDSSESNLNDADVVKFASSSNHAFDDIYILDTAGGIYSDFLGPRVVEGLLPSFDGDTTEWDPSSGSDHFALVDDPATALDTADYNESLTVGDDDLYAFQSLSRISGDINAVSVNCVVALEAAGIRTFRVKYRGADNVEGNGPTLSVESPVHENFLGIMELDPRTSSRWSPVSINTGQFGVEVVT